MKTAIIGAGASGVLCALKLRQNNPNDEIVIFERDNRILKKVLRSGSGRCNFGNLNIDKKYYKNQKLILDMQEYLQDTNSLDSNQYLEELGLYSQVIEDRLYPMSFDAKSFVMFLENKLFLSGVKVVLEKNITKIIKDNDKYVIDDEIFDNVVISIGSNANLNITDEEQYKIFNNMHLKLSDLQPALVGFRSHMIDKSLSGIKAHVSVKMDNLKTNGELIFKDDGLSGICVMDLSNYYKDQDELVINFFPDYILGELFDDVKLKLKNDPDLKLYNLLLGSIHYKILNYINFKYENKFVKDLSDNEIADYLEEFLEFRIKIDGLYDSRDAQIKNGGIADEEIDFFRIKKYPHIYVTGEALDNIGICGGYNLWFAFTSGLIVADLINNN